MTYILQFWSQHDEDGSTFERLFSTSRKWYHCICQFVYICQWGKIHAFQTLSYFHSNQNHCDGVFKFYWITFIRQYRNLYSWMHPSRGIIISITEAEKVTQLLAFKENIFIPTLMLRILISFKLTPWIIHSNLQWPPGNFHFFALTPPWKSMFFSQFLVYPPGFPITFTLPPGTFHWYPQQLQFVSGKSPLLIATTVRYYVL